MKSFGEILTALGAGNFGQSFMNNIPMHSVGSSKRYNKNTRPNPIRKAHKPLYGGMAHSLERIGQVPAPSPEQVKHLEHTLGTKLMVTFQGIHRIKHIGKINRFGKPMGKVRRVPGELVADIHGKLRPALKESKV